MISVWYLVPAKFKHRNYVIGHELLHFYVPNHGKLLNQVLKVKS